MSGYITAKRRHQIVLIQGLLSGRTVDMDEIEANFQNKHMVETIRRYIAKANGNPKTTV